MENILTLGIDVGSTASKCVILENGARVVAKSLIPVGTGTTGPARAVAAVLEDAGIGIDAISYTLATGYGRNGVTFAQGQMSELSCHAMGVHLLLPGVRTVVDVGGQDAKVLRVDANGRLVNFVMNDKCAAGTGRFLDVMARVLELRVDELSALGAQWSNPVSISSTCTVFAESEVISQLASGAARNDVIEGIHRSVASRLAGLIKRIGVEDAVAMSGGVAQNARIVLALEHELGHEIVVSEYAQYAGAWGAAAFAYQKYCGAPAESKGDQ